VANYNVDIAVALKGAKQLTSFNREVKATSTSIDAFAKQLKSAAKDQNLLVKSFENLNTVLSSAKANFNAVASGTFKQVTAAKELITAERQLNKEISLRNKLLTGGKFAQGAGLAVDPVLKSIQRNARKNRTTQSKSSGFRDFSQDASEILLQGQSSPVAAKIQQTLENRKKTEKEVAKIRERLIKKEEKLNATRRKILKEEITTRTRTFRQNQFGNVNPGMGGFRAFSQRADEITASAAATANRPGIGSLIRSQFAPGGSFAATRGQRFRGAASNALIGGGFPLLFGQGALGAAGGGIGGALGGALGGGFGFGLSIAGTAIAQQIQQTLDFRKSIKELNQEMQEMGISSNISGSQVRQLGKSLGITKEEAVKALQEFKRFGNDAVLIAKKFGGDFGRFDALTQANTVESALSAIRKINKDLTLEDELRFILSVQRKGVEATINDILTETLEKQKELDTAGFGQGVGGRKRPAVLKREREQLNEINTENTELIEKLTNIRNLNNEIKIASEESSFSIVKGLEDVNAEIRKLNNAQFQTVELSKTLGSAFSESFKGIIKGTMSVTDAFRSMFMRIADHFLDMAAQMMAAQISKGFLGLFGNAFSFGGGKSAPLITDNVFNTGFDTSLISAGAFANGGRPPVGRPSIVGEKGPELFVPDRAGTIIPNHAMGGMNIVVNVDASGSSVEGDEQQGRELGRLISVAVQSELVQQKRPGGLLA
jgi:hypothetical protein